MIIYSIMPDSVIWADNEKSVPQEAKEIEYNGVKLEVFPLQDNQYKINRILSSAPSMYLNPGLQPGNIIKGSF